ncbi:MAG: hypothetical protein NT133_26935, partial [Alphaproteobacteria bacterium]|nr:hypothetical protein [Alphaproteobacteria bacterium]
TGLALPLAAYALATTPTALPLGLAALLAAWVVGDDGPGWRVTSALGIAAIAGGTGLEYPGLAAAMLVGLSGIVASRHAATARLAAAALALPCLLPVAAVLASRSPWLLLPLALGLLPLAGAGRARPSWARETR